MNKATETLKEFLHYTIEQYNAKYEHKITNENGGITSFEVKIHDANNLDRYKMMDFIYDSEKDLLSVRTYEDVYEYTNWWNNRVSNFWVTFLKWPW